MQFQLKHKIDYHLPSLNWHPPAWVIKILKIIAIILLTIIFYYQFYYALRLTTPHNRVLIKGLIEMTFSAPNKFCMLRQKSETALKLLD